MLQDGHITLVTGVGIDFELLGPPAIWAETYAWTQFSQTLQLIIDYRCEQGVITAPGTSAMFEQKIQTSWSV